VLTEDEIEVRGSGDQAERNSLKMGSYLSFCHSVSLPIPEDEWMKRIRSSDGQEVEKSFFSSFYKSDLLMQGTVHACLLQTPSFLLSVRGQSMLRL
jgi:hypothetical protein